MILKAELHCHIEGTATPELVALQASRYGVDWTKFIQDGRYIWSDFSGFAAAYDFAASVFRTQNDYATLAENYLTSLARGGAIYSELFISPDHAERVGLSAQDYTEALADGLDRARAKTGIVARLVVTGVRHFGADSVIAAARFAAKCRHPMVTGFGMAGDERVGDIEDYVRAFEIAREAGLGITIHAGELCGAQSVEAALDHIRPARIGHGVRAIESVDLVRRIADEGIVLECCPGSNVALGVFADLPGHPYRVLREAGCKLTLNSDDPPFFETSLDREYQQACAHFGLDDAALTATTKTAIEAAFLDRKTKSELLARLGTGSAARRRA